MSETDSFVENLSWPNQAHSIWPPNHPPVKLADSLIPSLSTSSGCVVSVVAQIGCRASAKWVLHTGGGECGPPLHRTASECLEKRYINSIHYYY